MPGAPSKLFGGILEPMERISEVLFGVIMALTFTCALGVATADNVQVRTMLVGALGCNLAWGIIDAGVYLVTRVFDQGRKIAMLRAMREAADNGAARRIIADALPPILASTLPDEQLEAMRHRLHQMQDLPERPRLTRRDGLGAITVCLLCFLSTFPIALPFIFIGDARLALRVSNLIAVAMLMLCGYAIGYRGGLRPWTTALAMVVFGGAMVGVAIVLGG
jgi:hypothetical protein